MLTTPSNLDHRPEQYCFYCEGHSPSTLNALSKQMGANRYPCDSSLWGYEKKAVSSLGSHSQSPFLGTAKRFTSRIQRMGKRAWCNDWDQCPKS